MKLNLIAVISAWFACALAMAQPAPTVDAKLNFTALQPGQQAVLAVLVDIPTGFHSQSHTPSAPEFIAFDIAPDPLPDVSYLSVQYPPGRAVSYPALGTLNVYDGRVIAYLPFTVSASVPPGSLKVGGKLQIQLCDEQTCYRPASGKRAIPFGVDAQVVSPSQAVTPANGELFADFNPRAFAAGASSAPSSPPAVAATEIQVFGWTFQLRHSAYLLAFAIAFVVGVIFNLMPCVLPVVPLKAIGFYEASRHNRARCLLLGVIFSAGLLAVFALLALLVIVGGTAWGQLFSKGWFVWSIVALLTIMAAGQLGAFAVVLPSTVYNYVPTHSSLMGNFLFGGFTAILSTPCTAPMFVGLLLWAAGQPKWLGIATIQMVGVGMAAPYLVLAAFPQLARQLPRSGAWSELLKQFMAFLLLAVAAYFAAGRLIMGNAYLWIVFAIVLAGNIFLVARTWMISPSPQALSISSAIALLLTGGMLWFTLKLTQSPHDLIPWQPYSHSAVENAVRTGRTVMLEFTANWCANCKELESRVFTDPKTADTIRDLNILPIRADLTLDDAPGWEKLREISSSGGIPLTVIYSPSLSRPIQLSSIYTTDNLINALTSSASPRREPAAR